MPTYPGSSPDAVKNSSENTPWMESPWTKNHHSILQNKAEENQLEHHMHQPMTVIRRIRTIFYNRLQSVIDACPRREVTIPMGDLNAKIGNDNTGLRKY